MNRLFVSILLCWAATNLNAQSVSDPQLETSLSIANPSESITDKDNAKEWLNALRNLMTKNNFEARFVVYRLDQDALPYLWRHALYDDGPDMEQLNLQNGPGKEFIRVGNKVSIFEPGTPAYTVLGNTINGPIPWALLQNQESLYKAYEFIVVGRARISGKLAKQIRIVSVDQTRFSYLIWVDEESGMLLKMNMLDSQGAILEQIQMLGFSITPQPHDYFAKVNKDKLPRFMSMSPTKVDEHDWEVGYLPKGMKQVSWDSRRLPTTGQNVQHRLFSDGLVDVSVYVEKANTSLNKDIAFRHKVNTFLSRVVNGNQVTVIGKVPPNTANAIAQSVRPISND